ncbi:acetyltransferase [Cohnella abietis]|uniref:Putative acetyltransferase EpsM n=1 Tax=Cohnella abietis TaxID=2507935 RepID=A0A3T1D220_9BACL|nr:acetyltransferase [Cohnella abietis]BBI32098.1 putative acetyltransferase EpsM [Cohnella abietis]
MTEKVQWLIIIGSGGHGKVAADAAVASGRYRVAAFADDKYESDRIKGGILHAPLASIQSLLNQIEDARVVVAVGTNSIRMQIVKRLNLPEEKYATIIHPKAVISPSAKIGHGSVIFAGAVLNADAVIGQHAIVNSNAVVEHDCVIGDFVHISPAVAMAGGVHIEMGAHIGIGACLIPGVSVGAWSTLGAGAVAIRDVPADCTAVGVPASHIRAKNGLVPSVHLKLAGG